MPVEIAVNSMTSANADTTVYQLPAGATYGLVNINAANLSPNVPAIISIFRGNIPVSPVQTQAIEYNTTLNPADGSPNNGVEITAVLLRPGDKVVVASDSNDVAVRVDGFYYVSANTNPRLDMVELTTVNSEVTIGAVNNPTDKYARSTLRVINIKSGSESSIVQVGITTSGGSVNKDIIVPAFKIASGGDGFIVSCKILKKNEKFTVEVTDQLDNNGNPIANPPDVIAAVESIVEV